MWLPICNPPMKRCPLLRKELLSLFWPLSEKGYTLKGKNLLPIGANCFLKRRSLFRNGWANSFETKQFWNGYLPWKYIHSHQFLIILVLNFEQVRICGYGGWFAYCIRAFFPCCFSAVSDSLDCTYTCITKTRLFKYIENFTSKIWKFSDKKLWYFFHISAQNIDFGYLLEPPRQGGSNEYPQSMFLSRNKKIMYTPVNPSFTI